MLKLGSKNVSKLFLGGRAIANAYLGNKLVWQASQPLPYDAEVKYIETDGLGAYINTGIVPVRSNSVVAVSFNYVSWNTSWVAASNNTAFGARGDTVTSSRAFEFSTYVRGGVFRTSNPTATVSEFSVPLDHNIHDISLSYSGITFDGIGYSNSSSTLTQPVGYFCLGSSGTLSVTPSSNTERYFGNVRFYSCKIYTNGALVFDGIPVRKDGVAYIYDRVSGRLCGNAGASGTSVTYGPDANPISARSYVQNGLVAMWDGIENAGWGQHNSSATTWKDLIGTNDLDTMNGNTFGDNCALITNERLGIGSSDKHIDLYTGTVEMVCEAAPMGRASFLRLGNTNSSSYSLGISYTNSTGGVSGIGGNITTTGATFSTSQRHFAATYDGTTYLMYVDGVPATINATSYRAYGNIAIGGTGGRTYSLNGKVYSVRVYNRVLTAQEIAANYAIDKARFNLP